MKDDEDVEGDACQRTEARGSRVALGHSHY